MIIDTNTCPYSFPQYLSSHYNIHILSNIVKTSLNINHCLYDYSRILVIKYHTYPNIKLLCVKTPYKLFSAYLEKKLHIFLHWHIYIYIVYIFFLRHYWVYTFTVHPRIYLKKLILLKHFFKCLQGPFLMNT